MTPVLVSVQYCLLRRAYQPSSLLDGRYVFFSMAQAEAKEKLQVVPLGDANTTDGLLRFEVKDAHCFSKQDEAKIRSIIEEEEQRFELEIREVARYLKSCLSISATAHLP